MGISTRGRPRLGEERGQMLALLTVSVVALIACGAFVMDVGAWIQGHRATQAVADASALAGAQALPLDTGTATSIALDYSTKNGGGVAGGDIQFASNTFPSDTIRVTARRTGPASSRACSASRRSTSRRMRRPARTT